MRVLYVTHYPGLLGANRSLLDLMEGLMALQVKPLVLCPAKGRFSEVLEEKQIPYKIYPYPYWGGGTHLRCIKNAIKMITVAIGLLFWKKKIADMQPDIIYSNSSMVWVGFYLSLLLHKKHVWHIREFGKADYNIIFLLPKKLRMKIIAQSAAVIAISKAIQKKALSGVPAQKVRQIYNGVVSTSQIAHKAKKLEAGQKIKFCMLSGLFPDKGHEEAIRAFQILHAEFPDTTLSIAGDGNDEKYTTYLKNLVYKLDLTASITFLGYIDDPDKVYQQSDILLVCSKNEGMGRVTIEAMGQGLPVIGYEGGGTPELITHQHNGLMYKGGMAKLAEMMQYWILNPASYHQSSQNALATVRKKFTKAQYVESIYRVLKEVS